MVNNKINKVQSHHSRRSKILKVKIKCLDTFMKETDGVLSNEEFSLGQLLTVTSKVNSISKWIYRFKDNVFILSNKSVKPYNYKRTS